MDTTTLLSCALSSTLAVTVVTAIKEIIIWRMNRKAQVEDHQSEDEDKLAALQSKLEENAESVANLLEIVTQLEAKLNISMTSNRVILKDRVKFIALKYIKAGEISLDDKHNIKEMWNIYHYELGGNGDLDDIMAMIEDLQITDIQ